MYVRTLHTLYTRPASSLLYAGLAEVHVVPPVPHSVCNEILKLNTFFKLHFQVLPARRSVSLTPHPFPPLVWW